MTLEQYRVYRSLKLLHPRYITECFCRDDGLVTVIQHDGYGKLHRMIEVDKTAKCKVTEYNKTGAFSQEVVLPRERPALKHNRSKN